MAPSSTAPAISRIRSLPGERLITTLIRKKAKIRPAAANNIESVTPEFKIERARRVIKWSGCEVGDSREFCLAGNGYLPALVFPFLSLSRPRL